MPANLDITDGVVSYVGARQAAWHALGKTLSDQDAFTAQQAMEEGHLGGWDVRKIPLFTEYEGHRIEIPGRSAVIRNNPVVKGRVDVLGDVGANYTPIQNEAHADLLDALVDESGAKFDTAGALDGGKRVFITMKLPGSMRIGGSDEHEQYIAALNSHDGSMAFTFMVTPVRIVCGNTWNMAVNNHSNSFRIRHTTNSTKGITAAVRQTLDLTYDYLQDVKELGDLMVQTPLAQPTFEEIIAANFGAPEDAAAAVQTRAQNRLDEMTELFADSYTNREIGGTVWAGLNALTEWSDHYAPTRGDDRNASRAQKAILDTGFKTKALKVMSDLVPALAGR